MRPDFTYSRLVRPRLICHLVSSIDGRLLADRWTPAETGAATRPMSTHRQRRAARPSVDGVIVGSNSLAALPSVGAGKAKSGARSTSGAYFGMHKGRKLAVVIDLDGTLHYGHDDAAGHHIVAILGKRMPESYLAELREVGVSYLFAGDSGLDLEEALYRLGEDFGVESLLLEGGGRLNSTFMNAGLIDEISLLVCPVIDDQPGGLDTREYAGTLDARVAASRALRHLTTETLGDGFVWLRYAVDANDMREHELPGRAYPAERGAASCNCLLC